MVCGGCERGTQTGSVTRTHLGWYHGLPAEAAAASEGAVASRRSIAGVGGAHTTPTPRPTGPAVSTAMVCGGCERGTQTGSVTRTHLARCHALPAEAAAASEGAVASRHSIAGVGGAAPRTTPTPRPTGPHDMCGVVCML